MVSLDCLALTRSRGLPTAFGTPPADPDGRDGTPAGLLLGRGAGRPRPDAGTSACLLHSRGEGRPQSTTSSGINLSLRVLENTMITQRKLARAITKDSSIWGLAGYSTRGYK